MLVLLLACGVPGSSIPEPSASEVPSLLPPEPLCTQAPAEDFQVACSVDGCTATVPEAFHPVVPHDLWDAVGDTAILADRRVGDFEDPDTFVVLGATGAHRLVFDERVQEVALFEGGLWVQQGRRITQLTLDGSPLVQFELDVDDAWVLHLWGDAQEAWVGTVDSGWRWRSSGLEQLDVERSLGRIRPVAPGTLVELFGGLGYVYLWDRTNDEASLLGGSDDMFDHASVCGDGTFWVHSSTGASLPCNTDGSPCGARAGYATDTVSVCLDGELLAGVVGDEFEWLRPDGTTRFTAREELLWLAGDPERPFRLKR